MMYICEVNPRARECDDSPHYEFGLGGFGSECPNVFKNFVITRTSDFIYMYISPREIF